MNTPQTWSKSETKFHRELKTPDFTRHNHRVAEQIIVH